MNSNISEEEQAAREAFTTMPENGPQWKAVLWFLHEQKSIEVAAAIQPNLSNEARQHNSGRAAGISDLIDSLRAAHEAYKQ